MRCGSVPRPRGPAGSVAQQRPAVRPRPRPRRRGADLYLWRERRGDASRGLAGRCATFKLLAAAQLGPPCHCASRVGGSPPVSDWRELWHISCCRPGPLSGAKPGLPMAGMCRATERRRGDENWRCSCFNSQLKSQSAYCPSLSATNQAGGWRRYLSRKCICLSFSSSEDKPKPQPSREPTAD